MRYHGTKPWDLPTFSPTDPLWSRCPPASMCEPGDIWGYLGISGDALDAGWAHKNSQVVGKRSKSFTMVHQISPLPAAEVSKVPTWFKSSRVSVFLPTWQNWVPSPCGKLPARMEWDRNLSIPKNIKKQSEPLSISQFLPSKLSCPILYPTMT